MVQTVLLLLLLQSPKSLSDENQAIGLSYKDQARSLTSLKNVSPILSA